MESLYQKKLNQIKKDKEQYDAFLSNRSTVVKAGPGSGKTTVLTVKIMNLLTEKIKKPRGLACITYSNDAVNEFTDRLKKMGPQKRKNVKLRTVHSFCISEILVPFSSLYNKGVKFPLNLISEKDKKYIFNDIAKRVLPYAKRRQISDMDNERNMMIGKNSKVSLKSNENMRAVALKYEKKLQELNQIDFLEVVKAATELVDEQAYVRRSLEAKFPWILIDEYQDLGKPLHEMVLTLLKKTNIKFFIVGDPDQSIYSFQGSRPEYLMELYESDDVKSIKLKTNYRSNQEIIDISTIALNLDDREYEAGTRHNEEADIRFITCDNEMDDQYAYVVNHIIPECKAQNIPLEEICILTKSQNEINALSKVFTLANIPYYYARQPFLKNSIVLWLKDCASWLDDTSSINFTDLSGFWVKLLLCINEEERMNEIRKLFNVLRSSRKHKGSLKEWIEYVSIELSLQENIIKNEKYQDEIEKFKKFYEITVPDELNNFNLIQFSQLGKPKGQVTLSTRHSSKGLEFEVVVLLGLEDGNFPFYRSIDDEYKLNEERRVFYVSLTRAKRVCYLLRSKIITYRTRPQIKRPSMFWNELIKAVKLKRRQNNLVD